MPLTPMGLISDHVLRGDQQYIGIHVDTGEDDTELRGIRIKAGDCVLIRTDPAVTGAFRIRTYLIKPDEVISTVATTTEPEPEIIIRKARPR